MHSNPSVYSLSPGSLKAQGGVRTSGLWSELPGWWGRSHRDTLITCCVIGQGLYWGGSACCAGEGGLEQNAHCNAQGGCTRR